VDPADRHGPRGAAQEGDPSRLLVPLLALGVVATQLIFRDADDNRLTSWSWVFAGTNPARLFALVAVALAAAQLVARSPLPWRRPTASLALLSSAAAVCFWGEPEVIVDASRYFTQAKHLELRGLGGFLSGWGRDIPAWTDLPLVPALYGLVLRTFGEARVAVQAFTTLLFAGTVVLTCRTGSALWDEEVGFAGGSLLLAIPYLLTQVPTMLVDVPTMFFLALALATVVDAVQRGGRARIALAATAVFLAFLSKYSAWLLLTVLPAVPWVLRRSAPRALHRASRVALLSAILVLAVLLVHREIVSGQLALLVDYQAPGLRRWGESFLSTFFFQVHPFLTAAALASLWLAVRERDARWVAVAWPVLLLLVLEVRRIRYWVPAFPMLALLAARGLRVLPTVPARRLVVTSAVASSLVVGLYGQLPFLERTSAANLKEAGAYLDGIEERTAEVFTPRRADAEVNPAVSVPVLDLFTAKRLVYAYEDPPPSSLERARRSALRFTWEYRNPGYYAGSADADAAVVVVSESLDLPFPPALAGRVSGLRLARTFAADEGVFRHRTLVRVYRAEKLVSASGPGRRP
jgi:hypothetical protein